MDRLYRIYGAEMSPYSVKVRSYFRYKGIPHRWIVRNAETEAEYRKHAKIPIVPLVLTPDGAALQDSTPIIEHIEALHPEPSIHPPDTVGAFVSALLEEFGDEWGNKWMFHYRWARDVDQLSSAGRLAQAMLLTTDEEHHAAAVATVRARMVDRVWFVGSNEQNAPQIESSFREALQQLDAHLAGRPYLFGARPAFADFALWGQIYEAWTDPTAGALVEGHGHNVLAWVQRMLWPRAEGEFGAWSSLEVTLMRLLQRQVGRLFMPWTLANAAAVAAGREQFTVELDGRAWTQKPQKYHAKSLRALRDKYAAVQDKVALDAVLDRAGCLVGLSG
ncbi:MAG: glutathione S-transferase [Candidatus Binatia bacterium]